MLNVSIIDDDKLSRRIFKKYIDQTNFLNFKKEYNSAVCALEDDSINTVDLIILDVEMPNLNGLEFLEQTELKPQVIISSINSTYAVQAFDFDVTDFLEKPVPYGRFLQSIYRAQRRFEVSQKNRLNSNHIYIKSNNGYTRIEFDDIIYIEAYSDYMNIHTVQERFTALSTMKAIEERLPKNRFIRVHRSYIVQLDKINRFEDNMIRLGEKVIPVSRSCKENLLKHLNFF
ncbi:MAG: DNA-binding LytR/AlgR family response regulator [Crocinitomix sp.]|jgi:DNA-binding LytR/AlgR family response regulator